MKLRRLMLPVLIVILGVIVRAENSGQMPAVEDEIALPEKITSMKESAASVPPGEPPKPVAIAGRMQKIKGILSKARETVKARDFDELESLMKDTTLLPILKKGGLIMIPLLIASILAMGTVIDRVFFLLNEKRKRDTKALEKFFAAVGSGDFRLAEQIGKKSKFHVVRALNYGLAHKGKSLSSALLFAKEQEMKRYRRGIPVLDTIITLAPLLGLLGTVTGMMGSFSLIGGDLGAPGSITGGIAEALIATAFGLGIAITSLIPFNLLNTKMDEAGLEIEAASSQMQLLMNPGLSPDATLRLDQRALSTNGEKHAQFA